MTDSWHSMGSPADLSLLNIVQINTFENYLEALCLWGCLVNWGEQIMQFVHIIRGLFSLQIIDGFLYSRPLIGYHARVINLYYFESWVQSTQNQLFSGRIDSFDRHRVHM